MLPDIRNSIALFEGSHAIPTCPSLKRILQRWRWVWSIGKILPTGENRSTRGGGKYRSANSSTTNLTWTGPRTAPEPLKVTDLYTDTECMLWDRNEFLPIIYKTLIFE